MSIIQSYFQESGLNHTIIQFKAFKKSLKTISANVDNTTPTNMIAYGIVFNFN